jgi:hypothetical protein
VNGATTAQPIAAAQYLGMKRGKQAQWVEDRWQSYL